MIFFSKKLSLCSALLALSLLFTPLAGYSLEKVSFSRMIVSKELKKVSNATPDTKGHLLVLTSGKNEVLVLDLSGNVVTSFGAGIKGRKKSGLRKPTDIEIGPEGKIYISDTGNDRVVIYDKEYNYFTEIGMRGKQRGDFHSPMGIKIDPAGNLYVADSGNDRVQVFNPQGMPIMALEGHRTVQRAGYPREYGGTSYPLPNILSGTTLLENPFDERRKKRRSPSESLKRRSSQEKFLQKPTDVAFDKMGNVYVADTGHGRVVVFDKTGRMSFAIGNSGGKQKEFRKPISLLIDSKNRLYICDSSNSKIGVLNLDQKTYQELGVHGKKRGGEFNDPSGISLDMVGNLYVADSNNNRIQVFSVGAPAMAMKEKKKKEIVLKEDIPVAVMKFKGIGSEALLSAEMLTDLLRARLETVKKIKVIPMKDMPGLEPGREAFNSLNEHGAPFAVYGQVSEIGAFTEIYLKIYNTKTGLNEMDPKLIKIKNGDYRKLVDEVVIELKEIYAGHYLPPEPPTGCMVHGGDRYVTLSWKKPEESEISQFNIYRSALSDSGFQKIHETTNETYKDTDLKYGQTLYYQVTSVNLEGIEGKPSTVATAATFDAPDQLRSLKAIPLAKAIKINWKKAPDVDPSGFQNIGYRVYRSSGKGKGFKEIAFIRVHTKGKHTEYVDDRLKEDAVYSYKVTVVNEKHVESQNNQVVSAKTIGFPKKFEAISNQPKKVSLSWDEEESPEVDGYQIYISENGSDFSKLTKINSRHTNTYVDGGEWFGEKKLSGTNYYYRIATLGPKGYETEASPIITAQTKKLPLAPSELKQKIMKDPEGKDVTVRISWTRSKTRDVDKYEIFRRSSKDKDFSRRGSIGSLATFYDDERVKSGQAYEYLIKTIDEDKLVSLPSSSISVTP